jgi:ketosteroid isomerase-like protein
MTSAEQKEMAIKFINLLDDPKPEVAGPMLTDDFEFQVMARMPGMAPAFKKADLLGGFGRGLKKMFPNGLNMKIHSVICEGPQVAVQAESDTVVGNGKRYNNRYHFYVLFRGNQIAQFREYNDSNHAREVLMS